MPCCVARTTAALLVSTVDDVVALVGSIGEGLKPGPASGEDREPTLREVLDDLDPVVCRVFDGMPAKRRVTEGDLAVLSGVSPIDVLRAVPVLRLAGLIEADADGYRIALRYRRSTRST